MDVVADLPADPQAAETSADGRTRAPRPRVVCPGGTGARCRGGRSRSPASREAPDQTTVLVVFVAAVAPHHVRTAPGSASLSPYGSAACRSGISCVTSLRSRPVRVAARGRPVASVIRWRDPTTPEIISLGQTVVFRRWIASEDQRNSRLRPTVGTEVHRVGSRSTAQTGNREQRPTDVLTLPGGQAGLDAAVPVS